MIRKCCVEDIEYLKGIIKKDIFQNVYLYIDTSTYGFENQISRLGLFLILRRIR